MICDSQNVCVDSRKPLCLQVREGSRQASACMQHAEVVEMAAFVTPVLRVSPITSPCRGEVDAKRRVRVHIPKFLAPRYSAEPSPNLSRKITGEGSERMIFQERQHLVVPRCGPL